MHSLIDNLQKNLRYHENSSFLHPERDKKIYQNEKANILSKIVLDRARNLIVTERKIIKFAEVHNLNSSEFTTLSLRRK